MLTIYFRLFAKTFMKQIETPDKYDIVRDSVGRDGQIHADEHPVFLDLIWFRLSGGVGEHPDEGHRDVERRDILKVFGSEPPA